MSNSIFKIVDVFEVYSGSTPSTTVGEYWGRSGEIDWITPKDLSRLKEAIIHSTERQITSEGLASCSARLIPSGSIIISSRAPIGYVAVLVKEMACNQGCKALVPRKAKSVEPLYVYYLLTSRNDELNRLGAGSTFKELSKSKLEEFEIPLPDLATQQKIAETLAAVDKARQQRKAAKALTEQFLQGSFLHMFGDPVRNEKGWEVKPLGDCVMFKGGGTPDTSNESFYDGDIPWISPKDMKSRFVCNSIDKITEAAIKQSATKLIDAGNVLMVVRSGILKRHLPLAINTVPVAINQDMKALACKANLLPHFLLLQLEGQASNILQNVRGTTADNLSSDVLKNVQLILPPLPLQQKFANLVSSVEQLRQKQAESEQELETLFQSLLQRYFGQPQAPVYSMDATPFAMAAEKEVVYGA